MFSIIILLFLIFIAIFTLSNFITVKEREVIIIESLGKYNRCLTSGLHFIIRPIEEPKKIIKRVEEKDKKGNIKIKYFESEIISLKEIMYTLEQINISTRDYEEIIIKPVLYFVVTDPRRVAYAVENLPISIEKLTTLTIKDNMETKTLDDIFNLKEELKEKIKLDMDKDTDTWGIKIKNLELEYIRKSFN